MRTRAGHVWANFPVPLKRALVDLAAESESTMTDVLIRAVEHYLEEMGRDVPGTRRLVLK